MNNLKYLLIALSLLASPVHAEDSGGYDGGDGADHFDNPDIQALMVSARDHLGAEEYKDALSALHQVVRSDRRNADAWNLIGYSNRKLGKYRKASRAYRKALKYNPDHRGALEYQGELFIRLEELDKARENLHKLAVLCPSGCEARDELQQSIKAATE